MDYAMISVKLVTGFFGLWFMTKLLGKKEISQLTPFDFVSSLMLSELVGNTVYDRDAHFSMLIYALALWMALSLALEKAVQLVPALSIPLNGRPDIIIRDGEIDVKAMKQNRLDMHQVGMLLREQGVFSVREVAFAVFEPNGSLSVMKKPSQESPTRAELRVEEPKAALPRILIEQGKLQSGELKEIGRSEEWLLTQLEGQGINRIQAVYYAEWTEEKGLHLQLKDTAE
ncbi:YetF domain-containing protein [Paenibacillus glycanilyticus]|uniref:YetF domain-containing protein n=1 Tax=Paenibacillus glycanilyticus TaxID=126569 RepID=UPI003EB69751